MKCVTAGIVAAAHVVLIVSCTAPRPEDDIPGPLPNRMAASMRAKAWLAAQQRGDGWWGEEDQRTALTSLAVLAFLACGETPASQTYGKTVENGLRALLRGAQGDLRFGVEGDALLAWCLAEGYGMTRVPMLLEAARKRSAMMDFADPTPWHILAVDACAVSGAVPPGTSKQRLAALRAAYPSRPDSILDQGERYLIAVRDGGAVEADLDLAAVRRLGPSRWREDRRPLATAVILSKMLWRAGGHDWLGWDDGFYADMVGRQIYHGSNGWWTAEGLAVSAREIDGFRGRDRAVYVTALMLLTLPPERWIPTLYDRPVQAEDTPEFPDAVSVDIEL